MKTVAVQQATGSESGPGCTSFPVETDQSQVDDQKATNEHAQTDEMNAFQGRPDSAGGIDPGRNRRVRNPGEGARAHQYISDQ